MAPKNKAMKFRILNFDPSSPPIRHAQDRRGSLGTRLRIEVKGIARNFGRFGKMTMHAIVLAAMLASSLPMAAIAAGMANTAGSTISDLHDKQVYSAPQFTYPEPRLGEGPETDSLLQTPIPERHILGYQPVTPIRIHWGSLGQSAYVPIQPQHEGSVVGVVLYQSNSSPGTGAMAIALGDTGTLWQQIYAGTIAWMPPTSYWPSAIRNLYTSSELQHYKTNLLNDYGAIGAAVDGTVIAYPTQTSWSNGLRVRYVVFGGLGRPDGWLYGYVYIKDALDDQSLITACNNTTSTSGSGGLALAQTETCISTTNGATRYAGDPVNVKNGGLGIAGPEISFETLAGSIAFQPSYASLKSSSNGVLGYGWTHNLETKLIFPGDLGGSPGIVWFKANSANLYRFSILQNGTFLAYPGLLASLVENVGPPITYTLTTKDQIIYQFDEDGKLLYIQDAKGNQKTFSYNTSGLLERVEGPGGNRYLQLTYDNGLLASVTDHTNRSMSFGYDVNGDLASVTDVLGQVWTYSYDAQHRLLEIFDPASNSVLANTYDALGRVTNQYDGQGNLLANFIYGTGSTQVLNASGATTTYYFDSRSGTVLRTQNDLGNSQYDFYDASFRPQLIFDENGSATQMSWSLDGANLLNVTDALGNEIDLTYDSNNHLTSFVDPRGYLTTYGYQGNLLNSVTDALNGENTYTYTAEGLLQTETDARGNVTSYDYDANGQLLSVTDALQNTWTYEYDGLGRVVNTTDPLGRVTHNEYDAAGRVTRVIRHYDAQRPQNDQNVFNLTTDYVYDARGNLISQTDTLGEVTSYTYDAVGHLLTTTDPSGAVTTNTYNALGQLVSTTDALSRTTTYTYDDVGRLVATSGPLSWGTSTTYNPNGTVASTTDALGRITRYQYDALGRNTRTTFPDGSAITNQYDDAGNLVSSTDSLGRTTHYAYDALGRLIREEAADGGVTEHFYDANGNRIQTIDPRGNATTFAYDDLNRLVTITDALGKVTAYTYDALGNRSSITDANGHETQFVYDALNRLVSTVDALDGSSTIAYDALGRRTSVTDELGRTTQYTYDEVGRVLSVTDSIHGVTSYTYDDVGNQLTVQDQNGHTASNSYDALNRPTLITDANGNHTTTAYDLVGNVVSVTDDLSHSTTYAYNSLNRLITMTDALGHVTRNTYDSVGNRTSMVDANSIATRYQYNPVNRLIAVTENYKPGYGTTVDQNVKTQYAYDDNGNRLSIINGRGKVTNFAYDDLNRVLSETDPLSNTISYTYDDVGNLTSTTNPDASLIQYSYDALNRLTAIDYPAPDADTAFSYDAAGQRTAMQDGLGTTTWTYDNAGRPVAINDPFGSQVSYSYDAAGNRTSLNYPDGKTVSYNYDAANRLVNVNDWSSLTTQYSYDGANRLTNTGLPNGVSISYTYDSAGRITAITSSLGTEQLASYEYGYDRVGNRTTAIETYLQPNDLIFADDFESGDLSKWTAAQTGEGLLLASTNAAMQGSFGLEAVLSGREAIYVQDDTPEAEANYRARFYFSPNSISTKGDSLGIFTLDSISAGTLGQLLVREEANQIQLQIQVKDLSGSWFSSDWAPISRGYQAIEIEWHSASALDQPDGSMKLWIDDQEKASLDGISNFGHAVDTVYLGAGVEDAPGCSRGLPDPARRPPSACDQAPQRFAGIGPRTSGILYFDAFESRRTNHIGLITNPAPVGPDAIFEDEFESGDLSAWSSAETASGDLAATQDAAVSGSFGLQALLDNGNTQYVQDDTPNSATHYRARFYLSMARASTEGDILGVFTLHAQDDTEIGSIQIRQDNGIDQVRIAAKEDNLNYRYSDWITINDFWHALEIEWSASKDSLSNSGAFTLWIDGQPELQILFLDNDTFAIDHVRLGAGLGETIDANSSGKIYFDAFVSRNITYIGPDPNVRLDQLLFDGFESGDLSAWSGSSTGNGALSVTDITAFEGDYSLRISPAGVESVYVQSDLPMLENRYRARFYMDARLLNNEGDVLGLFALYSASDAPLALAQLQRVNGELQIGIKAQTDSATWQESSWIALSDARHAIEIDWRAASPSSSNGTFTLWIDGVMTLQLTGIDNETLKAAYVRLGAGIVEPIAASTNGDLYLDSFASQTNSYIGFDPGLLVPTVIDPDYIHGLQVWLDATQISGVADGTPIGAWPDLSGAGQNAVQATGASQPIFRANEVNGHSAIDFDGVNDYMSLASLTIGSNTTIVLVAENGVQTTNTASVQRALIAGDSNPYQASGTEFGLGYKRSGQDGFNVSLGTGSALQELNEWKGPSGLYETHMFLKSGTSATLYRDFYPVASGTMSRTTGFGSGYLIGAETSNSSRYFKGGIAEIIVFDHALSVLEREHLDSYLAEKYLVQEPQATPTAPAPSGPPLQISGLSLWLDATQIFDGYDGMEIGAWLDLSGNNKHATQTDVNRKPRYRSNQVNGLPAVVFDGSNDLLKEPNLFIPYNTTIYIVAENSTQPSYTNTIYRSIIAGDNWPYFNSSTEYGLGYKRSGEDGFNVFLGNGSGNDQLNTSNAPNGLYEIHSFIRSGTSAWLLRNFAQVATGSMTRTTGLTTGYNIGGMSWIQVYVINAFFRGGIAEIIVYDHALSAEEQSTINNYLSQKYGIAIPPTATPTATSTPSGTPTETPTETPTPSETLTPSDTTVATETPTDTQAPTDTPSLTPSETFTPEPTLTPSETPTPTDTPSGGGFNDPNFGLAWVGKLDGELSSAAFRLPNFTGNIVPLPTKLLDTEEVTRTIQYSYDALYRLTSAEYDDGNFFNYTYDSVGNRLSETTQFTNTIYAYDASNRLTSVNGVPYSWDANGNLLSDGENTFSYDHANRLMSWTDGTDVYAFAYNGLGDRLQQTVNGVTANYTLDLNTGLTQVLADGTNSYLYGVGRIGQSSQPLLLDEWAYHLPDALGSVRQLTDANGAIGMAQSYEPYGESLGAFGSQATAYGFAGEWTDASGLQYLRARYYAPDLARFTSRDPWQGDSQNPMSYNSWLYAYANPINLTDPSGMCPDNNGDGRCDTGGSSNWLFAISQGNDATVNCELPTQLALTPSGAKLYQWYAGIRGNASAQTAIVQNPQPSWCGIFTGSACEFLDMSAKNTSMAWTIINNPQSPGWGKVAASAYLGAEAIAVGSLGGAVGLLVCGAVPVCYSIAIPALVATPTVAQLATMGTNNPTSTTVILGSWPQYIQTGIEKAYSYFSTNLNVSEVLRNEANIEFLNRAINQGKQILISVSDFSQGVGQGLKMEIEYLLERGYPFDFIP